MADAALLAQIAGLERAIYSGVLTAEYDGKKVSYRSQSELLAALSRARAQASGTARPRAGFVSFSRGDE